MTTKTARYDSLTSRKFLAYLLGELTWKFIIVGALWVYHDQVVNHSFWWFLVAIALIAGFLETAYIGSTAWLDRYVRLAEIATHAPPKEDSE